MSASYSVHGSRSLQPEPPTISNQEGIKYNEPPRVSCESKTANKSICEESTSQRELFSGTTSVSIEYNIMLSKFIHCFSAHMQAVSFASAVQPLFLLP